jgi:aminoglycoside phosphotransferase (APT) family kinase protein
VQPHELRKIAEGREAEMFAWEEGTILRLLRNPQAQRQAQREAAAIKAASDRGVRVPAVHGLTTVMDRPGVVMERIEGPDLLTLMGRRPWMVFSVGRICAEVHAQLHAESAPSVVPPLRAILKQRIESSGRVPEDLAEFALDVLEGLPDGDSLCHGDFHPGNIMMSQGTPVVIDWTNATRGDPAADVARTLVLFRVAKPLPGSPVLVRYLRLVGSKIITSGYLRAYRRLRPLDMGLVARWEVAQAAARLASEPIAEEDRPLLRLLEQRRARSSGATSPGERT